MDFDFENLDKFFRVRSNKPGKFHKRGEDNKMSINVSFREAVFGILKTFTVSKLVICDVCDGNQSTGGYK